MKKKQDTNFKKFNAFCLLLLATFTFAFSSCKKGDQGTTKVEETKQVNDCLPGYHWDSFLKKCVQDCPPGYVYDPEMLQCVPQTTTIYVNYGGATISYNTGAKILGFSSFNDLNKVLSALDSTDDVYNDAYEGQYPNLTADQLDSVDQVNSFDELKKFRDFENLFSGYYSKRAQLENMENTWLNNDMTGNDPDDLDYLIDDAENAIFNSSYQIMVANTLYQFGPDGLYDVSSGLAVAPKQQGTFTLSDCFTNKKKSAIYTSNTDANRKYKLKVGIGYMGLRSSAKGKVVAYKVKNGKFKRTRESMAAYVGGTIYDNFCSNSLTINKRKPTPSGFKKRRSLKAHYIWWETVKYQTKTGVLGGSFELQNGQFATLPI